MKQELQFIILDKFAQLIDMEFFLYKFNTMNDIFNSMSKIRFLKELNNQYRIVNGALNSPLLSDEMKDSYLDIQIVLDKFKGDFDKMYPQKDYPELLI